jgi:uncharacterized protein (TIGR02271 family)
MLDQNRINDVMGSTVYDSDGSKIGKVGQVYTDDNTGQPTWATVNTGLFGTSESFVPIQDATFTGDDLTVPYSKDQIKDAPNIDADGHLSPDEERRLYEYYSLSYDSGMDDSRYVSDTDRDYVTNADRDYDSAANTTDNAMTRSEERIDVGTQTREAGRARLRKYVVTENVSQTVPVRKEKAVLEREPITDANVGEATDGPDFTESEHDVVLHEEVPVVQKSAQPVERVRLGTEEVQGEETVSEEVRKEQIEAEGDLENRNR